MTRNLRRLRLLSEIGSRGDPRRARPPAGEGASRGQALRRRLSLGIRLALTLTLAAPSVGRGQTYGAGHLDFSLASNTFRSPLFGPQSPVSLRLFMNQELASQASASFWYYSGFPTVRTDAGFELADLALLGGRVTLEVGDIRAGSAAEIGESVTSTETVPLRGAALFFATSRTSWSVYGGRAMFRNERPGENADPPQVIGSRCRRRWGRTVFGASLNQIQPGRLDEGSRRNRTLLSLDYFRELTPTSRFFGVLTSDREGRLAGRLGTDLRFPAGALSVSVYSFDAGLPELYPLFRPGEFGVDLRARWRVGRSSILSSYVNLMGGGDLAGRKKTRGGASWEWDLGDNRPQLLLSYARDELTVDSRSISDQAFSSQRLALRLTKSGGAHSMALALEYVASAGAAFDHRSQLYFESRKILGSRASVHGTLLVQADGSSGLGSTLEATLERHLRGSYSCTVGLGGAYVQRLESRSGDGALRVGLARRSRRNGWSARLEATAAFPVGLPQANLVGDQLALDFSHRLSWSDPASLRAGLPFVPKRHGSVGGTVLLRGAGLENVDILVDGEYRASTDANGRFRVRRLPEGEVNVSLDLRTLDPRLHVLGSSLRSVEVKRRETVDVSFELQETSLFQGSVVYCRESARLPVRQARILVTNDEVAYNLVADNLGSFTLDRIEPGVYDLILESPLGSDRLDLPSPIRRTIDLFSDVTGFVVEINCSQEEDPREPSSQDCP